MKTATAPADSTLQKGLPRATHYRWVVLAIGIMFYMINHADRANFGVVLPYIKKEYLLTNLQAGSVASFFFLGYAVSQIPAGLIMGKIGARLMTSLSIFFFSVFTFLIGTSPGPTAMKVYRFGLGLGEGPSWIGGGTILKTWFPHKEQATATGVLMASSQVSAILVPPVCVAIMLHWGWRTVFYSFAIPGIIISAIWYIFVRNRPEESSFCNDREREYIGESIPEGRPEEDLQEKSMGWVDTVIRVRRGMRALDTKSQVFRSWNIWAIAIVTFFTSTVMYGMMTWVPSYLVTERHLTMIRMGWLAAVPFLGGFIGIAGGGWASDRLWRGRRKPMIMLPAIAGVIMLYLLANAPASQLILAVLLFLNGLTISCNMSPNMAYTMGLTNRKSYPAALAIMVTLSALSGFSSPMIAGYLLDVFKSFHAVFYFFTLAFAMTFVVPLTIVEPLQTIGAAQ